MITYFMIFNIQCIHTYIGMKFKTAKEKIDDLQKKTNYPVVHKKEPLMSVIIGNEIFNDSVKFCKLDGTPTDVEKMKDFLSIYGIQSSEYTDLNANDMTSTLESLSRQNFSKKCSGLIVTIITHGGEGNVLYGTDGQLVQLKELAKLFNSSKCKGLRDKPKIFIINACRGKEKDKAQSLGPHDSKLSNLSERKCKK